MGATDLHQRRNPGLGSWSSMALSTATDHHQVLPVIRTEKGSSCPSIVRSMVLLRRGTWGCSLPVDSSHPAVTSVDEKGHIIFYKDMNIYIYIYNNTVFGVVLCESEVGLGLVCAIYIYIYMAWTHKRDGHASIACLWKHQVEYIFTFGRARI